MIHNQDVITRSLHMLINGYTFKTQENSQAQTGLVNQERRAHFHTTAETDQLNEAAESL